MPVTARVMRARVLLFVFIAFCTSSLHAAPDGSAKLDRALRQRTSHGEGRSHVIVRLVPGAPAGVVESMLRRFGGRHDGALPVVNGHAGELPNAALVALAASPWVASVSDDRPIIATMDRTAATVGAAAVRASLGYDGSGVGVAIVDSGIARHDDLADTSTSDQRVERFIDLVNGRDEAYDDYGHGTHVAGIVAGNGYDSSGARSGIAPAARLIVFKVLDDSGTGRISNVISALGYIINHKQRLNIRVVNLSIRAGVYESYDSDPLTVAADRVVREGIVVVAAAGNRGRNADGHMQYAGVTAPGNAPAVLTVGAANHMGTVDRSDDSVATFSSRGPAAGGYAAKPDLLAPGVGIESLSAPGSVLYVNRTPFLLGGTVDPGYLPYLSLSGTSMAAPVVTGTVALMLQANPSLTPNEVKAILQYTSSVLPNYDALTQGAGLLNAKGAVELAQYFAAPGNPYPDASDWGRRLIWGNRLISGGRLTADANAWSPSVKWGSPTLPSGKETRFGVTCAAIDCEAEGAEWTAWGTSTTSQNVVWGSLCGGDNCDTTWSAGAVFASDEGVVWGMDHDAVVWGVSDDGVVWGMSDDGVVWGLNCPDQSCEPVIWGGP